MLDTLDVAQSLRDAKIPDAQAVAIAKAVGRASEHGDHVTRDQFQSGLAELRLEIAAFREGVRDDLRGEIAGTRDDLRGEIAGTRDDLRGEIADVRTDVAGLRTDVAGLQTEIANVETRLIRWFVGVVLGMATMFVAMLAILLRLLLASG